jgi:urease accessory protein
MFLIDPPAFVSPPRKSRKDVTTKFVGRVGELRLDYARRDHKTIIARSHCTSPWHLLPTIYLDETGAAYTLLLNPSGGLVGGDHLSISMSLDAGTQVLISTPSANRVYQSLGEVSVQEVHINVGPDAVLEWVPEPTIPFAGSRYRQVLQVTLAPGATIFLWDAIASGRIAREEQWAFTSLENEIQITTASGASVLERFALDPATDLGRVGLAEEWDYIASLYVVNDVVAAETWSRLETRLAPILDAHAGLILGGVSTPAAPGVVVKLLARTAPDLTSVLQGLWAAVRMELWNLPPVAWRKY